MRRPTLFVLAAALLCSTGLLGADAEEQEAAMDRPAVPGVLRLNVRERVQNDSGDVEVRTQTRDWKAAETAIIICDMWDDHYCKMAAQRVGVMAPVMNQV